MKLHLPEHKGKKKIRLRQNPKKKSSLRSSQLLTLLGFIALSSALWLLQSMQNVYTTRISIPIVYANWPPSLRTEKDAPDKVEITLSDKGFNLLSYTLDDPAPIRLELSQKALNSGQVVYSHAALQEQVQKSLLQSSTVQNIYPETIRLRFYQVHSKKVPVVPVVRITPVSGFVALPAEVIPKAVTLYGSISDLQNITYVETKPLELSGVEKEVNRAIELNLPANITAVPEVLSLNVKVEELTECSLDLAISAMGAPDGYVLRLLPSQAVLRLTIPLSKYEEFKTMQPQLSVNYDDEVRQTSQEENNHLDYLTVNVEGLPNWVTSSNVVPKKVQYMLEPK